MEILFDIIKQYGWQALVVAVGTFALIECLKPLVRKFVKKDNVRHTLYVGLNYAITLGFSALAALVFKDVGGTFKIYGTSIIVVNILYPVIENIGFFKWAEGLVKGFLTKNTKSGEWKKAILGLSEKFGVDSKMLDTVATKIEEEYGKRIEVDPTKFFSDTATELVLNIKQKLAGFADNSKLQAVAEDLLLKLKESWIKPAKLEVEGVSDEKGI